jgi:hypothetical protein
MNSPRWVPLSSEAMPQAKQRSPTAWLASLRQLMAASTDRSISWWQVSFSVSSIIIHSSGLPWVTLLERSVIRLRPRKQTPKPQPSRAYSVSRCRHSV